MKDLITTKFAGWGTVKTVLVVVVVIVTVYVIYSVYRASKIAGDAAGNLAGAVIIEQRTGVKKDRQSVCKQVADDVVNAIHLIPFTHFFTFINDDGVVSALNKLVDEKEASLTSEYFRESVGYSILDVINSWHFFSKSRVKSAVLSGLN